MDAREIQNKKIKIIGITKEELARKLSEALTKIEKS